MRQPWDLRPLLTFLVILSILLLGGGIGEAIGNSQILSFMLLGSFLIHMGTQPKRTAWLAVLAVAIVLRTVYAALLPFHPYFASTLISWGSFLGLASLFVQLVQIAAGRGELRRVRILTFLTAGALPYFWLVITFSLSLITNTDRTYDSNLLAFDSSLGASTSFLLGRLLAANPLLNHLTMTVYHALPLGASCLLCWYNRSPFKPVRLIPLYISMMLVGCSLYLLYPAAGPYFAYPGLFPQVMLNKWQILSMKLAPFSAPRNAMPSLHFGAVLLLMWNSRAWSLPGRVLAAAFSCGIAFSTLALGEHYLIDLVVAFPFMLALQACWSTSVPLRSPCRYRPLAAGVLGTAAWFAALRWAIPAFLASAPLAWFCVLFTIVGTLYLERRLARQVWGMEMPPRSPSLDVSVSKGDSNQSEELLGLRA